MEAHSEEMGLVDIVVIAYPAGAPMTGEAVPMIGPGRPRDHPRSRRRPRPEQPGRGALEDGEVADALAALAARRPCYELSAPMWRTWRASALDDAVGRWR